MATSKPDTIKALQDRQMEEGQPIATEQLEELLKVQQETTEESAVEERNTARPWPPPTR